MPSEIWQNVPPDQKQSIYVPQFFTLSPLKFGVMSIFSLGIYPLYWFYRNWIVIAERTGTRLSPGWRTILIPYWAYDFFRRIQTAATSLNFEANLPVIPVTILFVFTQIAWLFSEWGAVIYLFSFLPLLHPNAILIKVNQTLNANHRPDGRFSLWSWLTIFASTATAASIYYLYHPRRKIESARDLARSSDAAKLFSI